MPIIPVANGTSLGKTLSSWDRFLIPMPFSKVAIFLGTPISVPRELSETSFEEKRLELERAILTLTQKADRLFSQSQSR
jgi:lysophospholipid acyltransferase (LPLAT)-like uncharacterized protein